MPQNPFISNIGVEPLARNQTKRVGDTGLTSQELRSGICATQNLARGSPPGETWSEFLEALPESTNRAVARV